MIAIKLWKVVHTPSKVSGKAVARGSEGMGNYPGNTYTAFIYYHHYQQYTPANVSIIQFSRHHQLSQSGGVKPGQRRYRKNSHIQFFLQLRFWHNLYLPQHLEVAMEGLGVAFSQRVEKPEQDKTL